ncbi:MAG TPA: hypothetical protein VK969_06360 [Acidimicrobiia bacterium]|nr:hypothetical protein [Acidimicrobiia bacterium]
MRRTITAAILATTMVLSGASVALAGTPANAGQPTCAGVDLGNGPLGNHGDHIKDDYVHPGEPGGAQGGPAHFNHPPEVGPGASFCLEQARAKSPSAPPGRG